MQKHPEHSTIVSIGARIKQIRNMQGMSQNQLAFESGMPRAQIGRIERGEINTSIGSILVICRVFNIHPKELFDYDIDFNNNETNE